ncbi:MAG: Crp/Fnr family transcriptional regulator [Polyangiaceae bacterium]
MIQLASEELVARAGASPCPDCPVTRLDVLESAVPPHACTCAFRSLAVRARAPLPPRWFKDFGLGIVRRGIVVRQRVDTHGRANAVDAVGAGGLVPLGMAIGGGEGAAVSGYAVGDVLLCAYPADAMQASMEADPRSPRDVLRLHTQALERIERLVDAWSRMTVVERTAALVCALVDTLSPLRETAVITADLQQVDLAALVSARQETVCRALGALEERGLIGRDGDGIRITDRRRLESV